MASKALDLLPDCKVHLAYRKELVGDRFDIAKIRLPIASPLDIVTYYRLYKYIKANNISVLLPTKRKDYFIAGVLARLMGLKNILRLGIVRDMKGPYHKLLYANLADGIIVNAGRIRQTLLHKKWFQPDRIRVIYNGFDGSVVDAASAEKIPKPMPLMLCSVGRVTSRKGFDVLIRGFAEYLRKYKSKELGLWIVGDGDDLEGCKALAKKLEVDHLVWFTGFQSNPYPYLQASDIFALLSQNEGISNALLEGIYTHNAIITTRAGGAEELITHNVEGLFVNYGDINQVCEALRKLTAKADLRKQMTQAAREKMLGMFSIPKMQSELHSFIMEIRNS
ncbi:MAG: glycosyltransferase [Candidatus Cloacimonadaceae bacterium]|nr:glycosyltransferase [Candidatus Cloacimonadaceae bacterium]